jgi:hypothetical protein
VSTRLVTIDEIARKHLVPEPRRSETRRRGTSSPSATSVTRRDREVAFVAARGGLVPWSDVMAELGLISKNHAAGSDLVALLRAKRLFGRRLSGVYMVTACAADLPAVDPTLPSLEVGLGERRDDCRLASDCLGRFVMKNVKLSSIPRSKRLALVGPRRDDGSHEVPARCPAGCASYSAIERHERIGMATRAASSLAVLQEHAPGDIE